MQEQIDGILKRGSDLLDAQVRLALARLQRVGAALAVLLAGVLVIAVGALVLLAAGTVVLAAQIGIPQALAITGAVLLIAGGGILLWAHAWLTKPGELPEDLRQTARETREREEARAARTAEPMNQRSDPIKSVGDAIKALSGNLAVVGAGAFALLAVLGPGRTIRTLARGASLAAGAASAFKIVREVTATARMVSAARTHA